MIEEQEPTEILTQELEEEPEVIETVPVTFDDFVDSQDGEDKPEWFDEPEQDKEMEVEF